MKRSGLVCSAAVVTMLATVAGCNNDKDGVSARRQQGSEKPAGRVLLVLTNHAELGNTGDKTGFYLSEAAHPYHVFKKANLEVTLASPRGGSAPVDPRSMETEAMSDVTCASFAQQYVQDGAVRETIALANVDPRRYDAIFFAGGHGTMWDFPTHPGVKKVGEAIYSNGGAVGAVCHGPAALIQLRGTDGAPIVRGKRVTAFTNSEEDAVDLVDAMPFLLETRLREQGARFSGAGDFEAHVVADGRLVTGQNPASAEGAAQRVVELVLRKKIADRVGG